MPRYPVVMTQGQGINDRAVDLDGLSEQIIPIRDALLKLFKGVPPRSRGHLDRLEVGLVLTEQGDIAFATGNTTPSLTLVLRTRQPSPSVRPATRSVAMDEPVIVEIDRPAGTPSGSP